MRSCPATFLLGTRVVSVPGGSSQGRPNASTVLLLCQWVPGPKHPCQSTGLAQVLGPGQPGPGLLRGRFHVLPSSRGWPPSPPLWPCGEVALGQLCGLQDSSEPLQPCVSTQGHNSPRVKAQRLYQALLEEGPPGGADGDMRTPPWAGKTPPILAGVGGTLVGAGASNHARRTWCQEPGRAQCCLR